MKLGLNFLRWRWNFRIWRFNRVRENTLKLRYDAMRNGKYSFTRRSNLRNCVRIVNYQYIRVFYEMKRHGTARLEIIRSDTVRNGNIEVRLLTVLFEIIPLKVKKSHVMRPNNRYDTIRYGTVRSKTGS